MQPLSALSARQARRFRLSGQLQGIGFRPHVHGLARRHGLSGWVRNSRHGVEIHVEGSADALHAFGHDLPHGLPAAARIDSLQQRPVKPEPCRRFTIRESLDSPLSGSGVPLDQATCPDCLRELFDPGDRRYRYPFVQCARCGPRYALTARLPFDRDSTAMRPFRLCRACQREYDDPDDRRFHAQTIACPQCGPTLTFAASQQRKRGTERALASTVEWLRAGRIVAIKGSGGYHLCCDARSTAAVARLRRRKRRPDKPLAVMVAATWLPEALASRAPAAWQALHAPEAPIVLTPNAALAELAPRLSPQIAPGLDETGLMLPNNPLQHLLLAEFAAPLVMTSANLSGEPVITDNDTCERLLGSVADAFLHHDRAILYPADDPVQRPIAGRARPLRIGRGNAPLEAKLAPALREPLLALGGQMKATLALADRDRLILSPHIGDLDTPGGLALLERLVTDLPALYGITPRRRLGDAHPGYSSRQLGRGHCDTIQHHHAHAAALAAEHPPRPRLLVFTWDAGGLGSDGRLWGGEALLGTPGDWQRVATLHPFRLTGGDRVAREPWRSALALCEEAGLRWARCPHDPRILQQASRQHLNTHVSHAAGRLFDGAAALLDIAHTVSYEGQAPQRLEALANRDGEALPLPLTQRDGLWELDWRPLIAALLAPGRSRPARAALLHASLAQGLVAQACRLRDHHGDVAVGLSGGVFQNRLLTEQAVTGLQRQGFEVMLSLRVPCNDAGLAFGQVVEFAARAQRERRHAGTAQLSTP